MTCQYDLNPELRDLNPKIHISNSNGESRMKKKGLMKEYREAVGCIVWDEDIERILLVRRSIHETSCHGLWESAGGKLEKGESPKQAADIELFEETGLDTTDLKYEKGFRHIDHEMMKIYHTIHYYIDSNFTPELSEEHDAFMWMRPEEIWDQEISGLLKVSHHLLYLISNNQIEPPIEHSLC